MKNTRETVFSQRLNEALTELGLSQSELARRIDVTPKQFSGGVMAMVLQEASIYRPYLRRQESRSIGSFFRMVRNKTKFLPL